MGLDPDEPLGFQLNEGLPHRNAADAEPLESVLPELHAARMVPFESPPADRVGAREGARERRMEAGILSPGDVAHECQRELSFEDRAFPAFCTRSNRRHDVTPRTCGSRGCGAVVTEFLSRAVVRCA